MKNLVILVVFLLLFSVLLSACHITQRKQTIEFHRRFEKYIQPEVEKPKEKRTNIDLSEGPKLNYNSNFGPSDVNFDFQVNTKY